MANLKGSQVPNLIEFRHALNGYSFVQIIFVRRTFFKNFKKYAATEVAEKLMRKMNF